MKIYSPQIIGNTTLTGSLGITGNTTLNGDLTVTGLNVTNGNLRSGASNNTVTGANAVVVGGSGNTGGNLSGGGIFAGNNITLSGGNDSGMVIVGGATNTVNNNGAVGTFIIGGSNNKMFTFSGAGDTRFIYGGILGGFGNSIDRNNDNVGGSHAFPIIIGGRSNRIQGENYSGNSATFYSTIINSSGSIITAATGSTIIGGELNTISGSNNVTLIGISNRTTTVSNTVYVPNLDVSGSAIVRGDLTVTGSIIGTVTSASFATSASYALSSSFATTASFYSLASVDQDVVITGSVRGNVSILSVSSQTASLDLSTGNFYTLALTSGSDTFVNPSNILPGQTVNLRITQPDLGFGTVSFPSSVKQVSGSAYVPTAEAFAQDIVTFISFDSTSLYLSNVKNLV